MELPCSRAMQLGFWWLSHSGGCSESGFSVGYLFEDGLTQGTLDLEHLGTVG